MHMIKRFIENEDGATAVEYGLIAALVVVATIGAMSSLGSGVQNLHNDVAKQVGDAMEYAKNK